MLKDVAAKSAIEEFWITDAKGNVVLVKATWANTFLEELTDFNGDDEGVDDQVDAFSLAFNWLSRKAVSIV